MNTANVFPFYVFISKPRYHDIKFVYFSVCFVFLYLPNFLLSPSLTH